MWIYIYIYMEALYTIFMDPIKNWWSKIKRKTWLYIISPLLVVEMHACLPAIKGSMTHCILATFFMIKGGGRR